jgi:serine/threonine protein kinase
VAPEMMRSNELSKASDVYSFAIVMYEALTWRMPYYAIKSPLVGGRAGGVRARVRRSGGVGWFTHAYSADTLISHPHMRRSQYEPSSET